MPNKQVEILLKAADQFTDATRKAELGLAAMKIKADNLNKSFDKLSAQHPTLSVDEARAAAVALENVSTAANKGGKSFQASQQAASGLAQMLGVQLPQAATNFLSKSSAIGPALGAAFTTVGVVGLVAAVGSQLPAAFEKVSSAITGWNDKAQKAYADFIETNNKARLAVLDLSITLDKALGRGPVESLARVDKALLEVQQRIVTLQNEAKGTDIVTGGGEVVHLDSVRSQKEIQDSLNSAIKLQNDLLGKRNELSTEGLVEDIENQREMMDWMLRNDAAASDFQQKRRADAVKTAQEFLDGQEAMATATNDLRLGVIETEKLLREHALKTNEAYEAGLELMRSTTEEIQWGTIEAEKKLLEQATKVADEWVRGQETMRETTDEINAQTAATERQLREKSQKVGQGAIDNIIGDISRMFTGMISGGESFWEAFKHLGKTTAAALLDTFLQSFLHKLMDKWAEAFGKWLDKITTQLANLAQKFALTIAAGIAGGVVGNKVSKGSTAGTVAGTLGGLALGEFQRGDIVGGTILGGAAIGAGIIAWLRSTGNTHNKASEFIEKTQDPFANAAHTGTFDKVVADFFAAQKAGTLTTQSGQEMLDSARGLFTTFNQSAADFAKKGGDQETVVKQAHATIDPIIQGVLDQMLNVVQSLPGAKKPGGGINPPQPVVINLTMDRRTVGRLVISDIVNLLKNENYILATPH